MPLLIPTVIERWSQGAAVTYDLYSRLLKDRIIFVGGQDGAVTTDSANILIAQLLYLDSEDQGKDISLYINSPGGMVSAGLAVYDNMQFIKNQITFGTVMSFECRRNKRSKRHACAFPHKHQPLNLRRKFVWYGF